MIDPDALFDIDTEAAEVHATEAQQEALKQLELSSWNTVDKTNALLRLGSLKPNVLEMENGDHLVYPGRVHWFQGEPASLKSFLAQYVVATEVEKERDVLYIDYESNIDDVVDRIRSLGGSHDNVSGNFEYVRPRVGTAASLGDALACDRLISSRQWGVCIIDGVTGSFALEGLNPNSGAEVALWMMALPERIASTGCAVIVIDHVTKDTEGRGRWAVGSGHKLAALDGASYTLSSITRLSRAKEDDVNGIEGRSAITLNKDRGGWITTGAASAVGTFSVTSYLDGGLMARIGAVEEGQNVPLEVIVSCAKVLNIYPGMTPKAVAERSEYSEREIAEGLMEMATRGWVLVDQIGQSFKHTLTPIGRKETLDV